MISVRFLVDVYKTIQIRWTSAPSGQVQIIPAERSNQRVAFVTHGISVGDDGQRQDRHISNK